MKLLSVDAKQQQAVNKQTNLSTVLFCKDEEEEEEEENLIWLGERYEYTAERSRVCDDTDLLCVSIIPVRQRSSSSRRTVHHSKL